MKLPAFFFYPGDWLKDPGLRRCSLAARGIWIDVMCLMFECEERGVLATAGHAWSDDEIARAVGGDYDMALSGLRELVDKGVASRNQSGSVYCRRMVRDEDKRKSDAQRQRKHRLSRACHAPVTATRENETEDSVAFPGRGPGKGCREAALAVRESLCVMFKRDPSEAWGYIEEHALALVARRAKALDELEELKQFRLTGDFFPQSIDSILANWAKTLDRARNENHSRPDSKRANRNAGTLNEGKSGQYRGVGKVVPLPVTQRPTTDADGEAGSRVRVGD